MGFVSKYSANSLNHYRLILRGQKNNRVNCPVLPPYFFQMQFRQNIRQCHYLSLLFVFNSVVFNSLKRNRNKSFLKCYLPQIRHSKTIKSIKFLEIEKMQLISHHLFWITKQFQMKQFITTNAANLAFFANPWTYLKRKDAIISQFVSWRNKLRSLS